MNPIQTNIRDLPHISHLAKENVESPSPPLTSLGLLKQCGTKLKRFRDEILNKQSSDDTPICTSITCQSLSSDRIMKLAKAQLLQLNSQKADVLSSVKGCFGAQSAGFPSEVAEDLELALLIQAAGEKVANKEFIYARKLLSMCDCSDFKTGRAVQRVVYYFAKALKERIDQEWGIISSDKLEGKMWMPMAEELDRIFLEPAMVACQQELPFCLETQFITTESILENVASAKRIHLIDFEIDNGSQWTLIMQAFAVRYECPLELLKITAVGMCKETMEETGKWLSSFAETINLPFSFKAVVSELKDLKEDFFELEADEVVAIDVAYRLWSLLVRPNYFEVLMAVIKNLKPCIILLKELEVNSNTPNFLERFNGSLFFFTAMFDCTKSCMEHQVLYRKLVEEGHFWGMIRNFITTEGIERALRHETIGFWRALFARFGIVETDLSPTALYQANLSLQSREHFHSCTSVMDGKCLILGWNGIPFQSISAWKFL
ncbi:hypothetical protein ACH5RR_023559 [Cinchona calisaya]|uniref:Uncharacterized protein n=1 Tax=Cinchona calisaya TaxID=153742 RepID=A0ABD2ZAZ5_9GENT